MLHLRQIIGTAFTTALIAATSCHLAATAEDAGSSRQLEGKLSRGELAGEADNDLSRGVLGIRYKVFQLRPWMGNQSPGVCVVVRVVKNGPADLAGVKKGDLIVAVEGEPTRPLGATMIAKKLKGEPGTRVRISIRRKTELFEVEVERGGIEKLPDAAFRSCLTKQDQDHDRESRIKAAVATVFAAGSVRVDPDKRDRDHKDRERAIRECDQARFAIDVSDFGPAEAHLRRAVKLDPDFVEATYLLGLVLDKNRKYEDATQYLGRTVELKPDWIDGWQAFGISQQSRGNLADAVKAFKKCVALTSDREREIELRTWITELEAQLLKPQVGASGPTSASADEEAALSQSELCIDQSRLLFAQEDFKAATEKLRHAIELAPQSDDAWRALALCYNKQKQYPEAIDAYKQYIKLAPDAPDIAKVWRELGGCLANSDKFAEALSAYRTYRELVAENPDRAMDRDNAKGNVWREIGGCQARLSRYSDALDAYTAYLNNGVDAPDKADVLREIGTCLLHLGRFSEALESYRNSLKIGKVGEASTDTSHYITAIHDEILNWPERLMPDAEDYLAESTHKQFARWSKPGALKVCFHSGAGVHYYKEGFDQIMRDAFSEWENASDGLVKIVLVDSPRSADIEVFWTDDVSKMQSPIRGGETKSSANGHSFVKNTINCLTINNKEKASISADRARTVTLHEFGHALGLKHSSNPNDIMFPFSEQTKLSERDKATLKALYKMKIAPDLQAYPRPDIQIFH